MKHFLALAITLLCLPAVAAQRSSAVADSATVWFDRGKELVSLGQPDSACACYYRAAALYARADDKSGQARSLLAIGELRKHDDDMSEARSVLHEAYALAEAVGDNVTLIGIVSAQRYMYHFCNDMESYGRTGLILDSLYAVTDAPKAKTTYYLKRGTESRDNGDYAMAEYHFNQYLKLSLLSAPEDSLNTLLTYNLQMAEVKRRAGLFDEAAVYAHRYKDASHLMFSRDNARWYSPYRELAIIYQEAGDSLRTFDAIDSLFVVFDLPDLDPMESASAYITRGMCHANFSNYELALDDYAECDRQTLAGEGHSIYHLPLLALSGGALTKLSRYDEALSFYEEFSDQVKTLFGPTSAAYARSLVYRAHVCSFLGQTDRGCELYAEASRLLMDDCREQLRHVSTAARESFWQDMSNHLLSITGFAVRGGNTDNRFAGLCYDVLLFSKALLLESEQSMYAMLRTYGTQQDVDDFAELSALRTRAKELERGGDDDAEALADVNERMRVIDNRLTAHSKTYSDYTSFLETGFDDIRASLGDDDVLIDFCDYKVSVEGDMRQVAYVIRRDDEWPHIVTLFTLHQFDSLKTLSHGDNIYGEETLTALAHLLWEPLAPYVPAGGTVYYVPSGAIYQVALETLPTASGGLLADSHSFVRLSSARRIAAPRSLLQGNKKAQLYGGLSYDVGSEAMMTESLSYDLAPLVALRGSTADGAFPPLIHTKAEVEEIADILSRNDYDVLLLSEQRGTEESFVSMHGNSPSILHVATHGFYYTPGEAESVDYLKGYKDAMALSGLALSGANMAWRGGELPNGVMSGILTADNIARLDLSATDMVVLSACRTACGAATPEGLFGLQRAFKKAGVGTLVMTLWDVSDKVTGEFMTAFYSRLPLCQWNKHEAFEGARADIRARYPEPFYWAAFIMVD